MSGQKKEKDIQQGLGTEEEKSSIEVKGSQTGENGRSFMTADRESISGKSPSDIFPSAIVGVDDVEVRFNVKEKSKGTALPEDDCLDGGKDRGVNTHVGREVKPNSYPSSIPKETSRSLGLEVEEDCGARAGRREGTGAGRPGKPVGSRSTSSSRVRRHLSLIHDQMELGAVQAAGAISGSGSISGSGLELGCIQGRLKGLDPDGASQSPSYSNGLIPDGQTASSPNSYWAKDKGGESWTETGIDIKTFYVP